VAHIVVDVAELSADEVVEAVLARLPPSVRLPGPM
jgi:hypothetical protein